MKAREDGVESTRLQTSDFAQVVAVTPGTTVPHQSLQNGNGLRRYAHSRYATYVDLACQARTAQNNAITPTEDCETQAWVLKKGSGQRSGEKFIQVAMNQKR